MKQWEYKILYLVDEADEILMNEKGLDGWELISVVLNQVSGVYCLFYKKEISKLL